MNALACQHCNERQLRHVSTLTTRAYVDIELVCCICEARTTLHFETTRSQTRAAWCAPLDTQELDDLPELLGEYDETVAGR